MFDEILCLEGYISVSNETHLDGTPWLVKELESYETILFGIKIKKCVI